MGNDRLALLIKVIGKLKKQLRSVLTVIRIFSFRREEKKRDGKKKRKETREKEKKIGEKWRKRQKRNP